jgi:hypothetical protein
MLSLAVAAAASAACLHQCRLQMLPSAWHASLLLLAILLAAPGAAHAGQVG